MTLLSFTSGYADDSGDKSSGTVVNKAFFEAIETAINTLVHSTTNTGVTPEDIIDEVVAARGSLADLDTRLGVILNEDGTLKTQSNLISTATLQSTLGLRNFYNDSRFEVWNSGDSSAPAGVTLSGTGAAVARTGAGLSDTTVASQWGGWSMKITYGSATARATKTLLSSSEFRTPLQGKTIAFGAWIRTSAANQGSIVIDDGVDQTRGGSNGSGTYGTGDGTNEWCYGTHTINGSATKLDVYIENAVSGTVYATAIVVCLSEVAVEDWFPERTGILIAQDSLRGTLTTGTLKNNFTWRCPFTEAILLRTTMIVITAPTDAALIADVNRGFSDSAYTTKPQIADGALANTAVGQRPDGTYQYRCFSEGDGLYYDIDQVGSTVAGADLTIAFYFKVFLGTLDLIEASVS